MHSINKKHLYCLADNHLGIHSGQLEKLIQWIKSLNAEDSALVFLGDLFHIWAAPAKFHSIDVQTLLNELQLFREQGGVTILIVGNRDLLFNNQIEYSAENDLPFDIIEQNILNLTLDNSSSILLTHGDLVNRKDTQYLKWRKVVKSAWFKFIVNRLPSKFVQDLMVDAERKMKQTNQAFRFEFPKDEWDFFLKDQQSQFPTAKLLIAGHFHPKAMIESKADSLTGLVLPDALNELKYLKISSSLKWELLKYD